MQILIFLNCTLLLYTSLEATRLTLNCLLLRISLRWILSCWTLSELLIFSQPPSLNAEPLDGQVWVRKRAPSQTVKGTTCSFRHLTSYGPTLRHECRWLVVPLLLTPSTPRGKTCSAFPGIKQKLYFSFPLPPALARTAASRQGRLLWEGEMA